MESKHADLLRTGPTVSTGHIHHLNDPLDRYITKEREHSVKRHRCLPIPQQTSDHSETLYSRWENKHNSTFLHCYAEPVQFPIVTGMGRFVLPDTVADLMRLGTSLPVSGILLRKTDKQPIILSGRTSAVLHARSDVLRGPSGSTVWGEKGRIHENG